MRGFSDASILKKKKKKLDSQTSGGDVYGHMTSSLQVIMAHCDWTEEEANFLQVVKEKNSSKQH